MTETKPAGRWAHDELIHAYWVEAGRILAGEYPGHPDASVARRKVDLLVDHGIRTFVDLTTDADRLAPYEAIVGAVARARAVDVRRVHHPIPDLGVIDHDGYDTILATIDAALERGAVYVHCWGGIGRTGTVVGCHLLRSGRTFDGMISDIARLRSASRKAERRAPETEAQIAYLRSRAQL